MPARYAVSGAAGVWSRFVMERKVTSAKMQPRKM
jgi:hypothetical protein